MKLLRTVLCALLLTTSAHALSEKAYEMRRVALLYSTLVAQQRLQSVVNPIQTELVHTAFYFCYYAPGELETLKQNLSYFPVAPEVYDILAEASAQAEAQQASEQGRGVIPVLVPDVDDFSDEYVGSLPGTPVPQAGSGILCNERFLQVSRALFADSTQE